MAKISTYQTREPQSRHMVMVIYPDAHILDVAGPIEILTGTQLFVEQDIEPYIVTVVAEKSGPVSTTCGLNLEADRSFESARRSLKQIDTLLVAGGHGTTDALKNKRLLNFVNWASTRARRVVSICTGAMILAEAGLLDNRRATTHWFWCPMLAKRYPNVTVDADALFVRDDHIWTSAGVTAGMDLSLALIEEDWGHDIALQIARYNVMYMIRPGGQAQFSTQLIAQQHDDGALSDTLQYILNNVNEHLTVTSLAARACMSERSFARKFKEAIGVTPAHYVELSRVQSARALLEQTDDLIEVVAMTVGFVNSERMRRAFQRHMGISATDYRERFQSRASIRELPS
ncbi:MAG: GlxA family transcriptional regulator [Granulosicoccus sp.]